MGFCVFNNVAIAAEYARAQHNLERIAIVDFDVHHGNGTQESFYDNPHVLYISTHQSPFYPGTGFIDDTSAGDARGTTVNIPLPAGCGDSEYLLIFEQIIVPVVRHFNPQLILVSAGYDSYHADGLALMRVSVAGFAQMARIIKELADELCPGRIAICLEGGYHLQSLAGSVKATFDVLLGETSIDDPLGPPPEGPAAPSLTSLISKIKEVHHLA
jgi:acetoin utilization deacetylase AcuC-like enzyme